MPNKYASPIELYMEQAFRLIILLIPIGAFCASLTFTMLKLIGLYPTVPWFDLIVFDFTDLIYIFFGFSIRRNCRTEDGTLSPESLRVGKIFLALVSLLQWNFISYLIPSTDFWAYFSFFAVYPVFFLDHIFVLVSEAGLVVSIAISWLIKGPNLLPVRDLYFAPNFVLRLVLILLMGSFLWLLTYLLQKVLVKELENVADYDSLTHLRNRRSLYRIADQFQSDCSESGDGFSVLMLDLDNFKAVNDRYGHECGDLILCRVADLIVSAVKDSGIVFRYGGEEFLVFVRESRIDSAFLAEHIRAAVASEHIEYNGKSVSVSLTVGIAESAAGTSIDHLIKTADLNMYRGKQSGKNVVVG